MACTLLIKPDECAVAILAALVPPACEYVAVGPSKHSVALLDVLSVTAEVSLAILVSVEAHAVHHVVFKLPFVLAPIGPLLQPLKNEA